MLKKDGRNNLLARWTQTTRIFFLLPGLIIICQFAFAQKAAGKLTGKVTDASTNESLASVSINVKGGQIGTTSITDGTYILTLAPGTYTLRYSYTGYKIKEITGVVIKSGESTFLNILMETANKELQGVVVTANVKKESQSAVYSTQKRSAAVSDGISQEAIRKTPDNNTAQVLRRVTGVNVQDNRFVVVRGLGEQYNQTMLNGAPMTSTETNRNAFAFDLIPAPVVESITVNKTATPDMPGNFAGGIVQINTKDFPDNNFLSVQLQLGFSDETYGKDFYSDKRGQYQWLGFDGGVRNLPKGFPTATSRVPFTSLNLQEQFRNLQTLPNNLYPINYGNPGFNDNLQIGYGKTFRFKNKTQFGIVVALNQRKTTLIEYEIMAREPGLSVDSFPHNPLTGLGYYSENSRYRYVTDLGGVINLAYRFGNNKITLKNLYSQVYNNTFTYRPDIITDVPAFALGNDGQTLLTGINYFNEKRRIINSILGGEHRTGSNNETRLDWNVNITENTTETPDCRNFVLLVNPTKPTYSVSNNADLASSLLGSTRLWTSNKDVILGGAFNVTTPFTMGKNKQLFKSGILFQNRNRKATGTIIPISSLSASSIQDLMDPSNYYPGGGQVNLATSDLSGGSGNYNAGSSLLAAYESLENKIGSKTRIIWGLRFEDYLQTVNLYEPTYYYNFQDPELNIVKLSARTTFNFLPSVNIVYSPFTSVNIRGAYSNTVIRPELKDLAEYQRFDLQTLALTSGNRDLKSTSIQNYDLKLEWFPSSGEIASFAAFYKSLTDPIEYIYSDLGNNLSSKYAVNTGKAYVKGLEAEIRKKLDFISFLPWLSHVTIFGNGSLLESKVEGKKLNSLVISSFSDHTLTGQPKYIINAGVSILTMKETFEITGSFNRTGDYINELGSSDLDIQLPTGKFIPRRPHYYVKARNLVDIVVSKSFLHNKVKLKFNVTNLLKQPYILYQDLNGNGKFDEPAVTVSHLQDRTQNYLGGIDNTASKIFGQRTYSFSFSYTF